GGSARSRPGSGTSRGSSRRPAGRSRSSALSSRGSSGGPSTPCGPASRVPDPRGDRMTDGLENAEKEFARWRFREQQLLETIRDLDEEESRLNAELARVEQQVAYYE